MQPDERRWRPVTVRLRRKRCGITNSQATGSLAPLGAFPLMPRSDGEMHPRPLTERTMDKTTRTNRDNLRSEDRELQNKAFFYVLKTTDKPVDWAYEVWDRCELHAGDRKRVEQPGPYVSICRPVDPLAGKPEGDIRSEDARLSRLAR